MKASKEVVLIFSCSFPELLDLSIQKEAFLRRDQADLLLRGITVARLDTFASNRALLIAMPQHSMETRAHTIALQACESKRSTLATAMIQIQNIAANTFTKKGTNYFPFKLLGINKLSETSLIDNVPVFVKAGNDNMTAMALKGLTATMLTTIGSLASDLTTLLQAPPALQSATDSATIARHVAENSHFTEMRNMCETGHIFYKNSDAVKAHDYVMADGIVKVINRKGIVKSNAAITRKAANLAATTKIRMKVSKGTSLVIYFGMTKTSLPTPKALTVLMNPNTFASTTAATLGYDLAGGIIHLIIRNTNEDDATFLAKIG